MPLLAFGWKDGNEMTSERLSRRGWLLPVLLLGPFMYQADATIANVATPSIHADLGASGAMLELVIAGYLIAFSVLVITGARLGQSYGYRRLLAIGAALFTGASLLCGVAPDPLTLVLARVAQGMGGALMFPQSLTGIQVNFTGERRMRAIGLYAIALASGAVVGQIFGGLLISADVAGSGWRAIFLINVPIGALLVLAALRQLPPEVSRSSRRLDLIGVVILSGALLLLVLPLAVGRERGWPAWTWLCMTAGVLAGAGFLAVERRVAATGGAPLVNVAVFARPAVCWALVTLFAATGTYYALLFTLALYLQQGLGHSALVSGLALVSWVAAFGLAGQLAPRLPGRVKPMAPVVGCLLLGVAYAAISGSLFAGEHDLALLIVLLGIGGLGLGTQFSTLLTHLTAVVTTEYAPDVSGVSTTTLQVGASVGIATLGTLYLSLIGKGGTPTHAFAVTLAMLACIALLAGTTAYRAIRAGHTAQAAPDLVAAGSGAP